MEHSEPQTGTIISTRKRPKTWFMFSDRQVSHFKTVIRPTPVPQSCSIPVSVSEKHPGLKMSHDPRPSTNTDSCVTSPTRESPPSCTSFFLFFFSLHLRAPRVTLCKVYRTMWRTNPQNTYIQTAELQRSTMHQTEWKTNKDMSEKRSRDAAESRVKVQDHCIL